MSRCQPPISTWSWENIEMTSIPYPISIVIVMAWVRSCLQNQESIVSRMCTCAHAFPHMLPQGDPSLLTMPTTKALHVS
jgi:hypothetical protein